MYVYNSTKHSVTEYSPYFVLFRRNLKLSIGIILCEHQEPTNEQLNYHNFIQTWKVQMKEAFKIAEENTKKKRSAYKRLRGLKAALERLEVGGRVLVSHGPLYIAHFIVWKISSIFWGKKLQKATTTTGRTATRATTKATLGTAAMTVMPIFPNSFQISKPTIRKWARGLLRNNQQQESSLQQPLYN